MSEKQTTSNAAKSKNPASRKTVKVKTTETKPVEEKSIEAKALEEKNIEAKPLEEKPVEAKPLKEDAVPVKAETTTEKPAKENPVSTVVSRPDRQLSDMLNRASSFTGPNDALPTYLL